MNHLIDRTGLDNLLVLALTSGVLLSLVVGGVMMRPREFWRWWESVVGEQRYRVPVGGGATPTPQASISLTETACALMRRPLAFWRWLRDVLAGEQTYYMRNNGGHLMPLTLFQYCGVAMEVEFTVGGGGGDDDDDVTEWNRNPLNDCTGILSLEKNVKVFSTEFTHKSLQAMDPEDQAMLSLIISFCATNFAQQHHDVKAFLSTHKTVYDDQILVVYVVCVVVPIYTTFKYTQLTELVELRMTRIIDIEVGPKKPNPRHSSNSTTTTNGSTTPRSQLQQHQQGQIQVTVQSMLNKRRLVNLSYTRIHFNTVMHSVGNDLPKERAIIKRPRRSFEEGDK